MCHVTSLLEAANRGDRQAAADLLPLVYDELRKLAAAKMGVCDEGVVRVWDVMAGVASASLPPAIRHAIRRRRQVSS